MDVKFKYNVILLRDTISLDYILNLFPSFNQITVQSLSYFPACPRFKCSCIWCHGEMKAQQPQFLLKCVDQHLFSFRLCISWSNGSSSRKSWVSSFVWCSWILSLMASATYGMVRYVKLVKQQGSSVLRIINWTRCVMKMWDLPAHSQSYTP